MLRLTILLAMLITLAADQPTISARWLDQQHADIVWSQPANVRVTCLTRNTTLLNCFDNLPADTYHMVLPPDTPNTDYSRWPEPGDTYTVSFDGTSRYTTILGARPNTLYFPIIHIR